MVVSGSDWSIVRFILKYFRGSSLTNANKTLSRSLNVHEVDQHGDILVHLKIQSKIMFEIQSLYLLINIDVVIMWTNCQKFTIWWKLDQWNGFTSSISSFLLDITIFWNDSNHHYGLLGISGLLESKEKPLPYQVQWLSIRHYMFQQHQQIQTDEYRNIEVIYQKF